MKKQEKKMHSQEIKKSNKPDSDDTELGNVTKEIMPHIRALFPSRELVVAHSSAYHWAILNS